MATPLEYTPLDASQVDQELSKLPGWQRDGITIRKEFAFDSYQAGVDFTLAVARQADEMNHHPDILLGFKKVTVTTYTHKKNATTRADIALAGKIESIQG